MTWRDDIMALPEPDRLPAALDMIRDLLGGGTAEINHWRNVLGARPSVALVFSVLLARPGIITPRETLQLALEFAGRNYVGKSTDVHVSLLRRLLRKAGHPEPIRAVFGAGYVLDARCAADMLQRYPPRYPAPRRTLGDVSEHPLERQGCPWDGQDDTDLKRMVVRGDELRFIAYELQRTERAVMARCDTLGIRRKLRVGPVAYPSRVPWDAVHVPDREPLRAAG